MEGLGTSGLVDDVEALEGEEAASGVVAEDDSVGAEDDSEVVSSASRLTTSSTPHRLKIKAAASGSMARTVPAIYRRIYTYM